MLAKQLSDRFPGYAAAAVNAIDPHYNIHQEVKQNWGEVIGIKTNILIINGRHPEEVYDLAVRRPLKAPGMAIGQMRRLWPAPAGHPPAHASDARRER